MSTQQSNSPVSVPLWRMVYTETSPESSCSLFADKTYGRVRVVITKADGSKEQHYVDGLEMLGELWTRVNAESMADWKYLEQKDVQAESDTVITVECRVDGRTVSFGTRRMPEQGVEKLQALKAIILSYLTDENEQKPFTVTVAGKTYSTVRGTGNSAGDGAVIDFNGELWWEVEGFTGTYALTEQAAGFSRQKLDTSYAEYGSASFTVSPDGAVALTVDGETHTGTCDGNRLYNCCATALGGELSFLFVRGTDPGTRFLEVSMRGLPYPETFRGYRMYLEKVG